MYDDILWTGREGPVMSLKRTKRLQGDSIPSAEASPATEPSLQLGLQLRHARLVKGLHLRETAERAGCSESLLSKIENNKAMPSVNTLHRLAQALGTTVAALLSEHATSQGIVIRKRDRPTLREVAVAGLESDGTVAEMLIPLGGSTLLQAMVLRIEPGGSSNGLRQHDGEEVGLVLSGQLMLSVATRTYHLVAGDSFCFKSQELHGFRNPGSTQTEVMWVNTPASV